jgi:hypothetical protein
MVLGLLLGSVVFPFPGMEFSVGPAAGTLIVGLLYGRIGRIGPFLTTLPHAAGQACSPAMTKARCGGVPADNSAERPPSASMACCRAARRSRPLPKRRARISRSALLSIW